MHEAVLRLRVELDARVLARLGEPRLELRDAAERDELIEAAEEQYEGA